MDVYMVWGLDNGEGRLAATFDEFSVDENYESWKEHIDAAAESYPDGTQVFVSDTDTPVEGTGRADIDLIWVADQDGDNEEFGQKWLYDAWSEFDMDENYEGFKEAIADAKDAHQYVAVTTMSVDYDKIMKVLTSPIRV